MVRSRSRDVIGQTLFFHDWPKRGTASSKLLQVKAAKVAGSDTTIRKNIQSEL